LNQYEETGQGAVSVTRQQHRAKMCSNRANFVRNKLHPITAMAIILWIMMRRGGRYGGGGGNVGGLCGAAAPVA